MDEVFTPYVNTVLLHMECCFLKINRHVFVLTFGFGEFMVTPMIFLELVSIRLRHSARGHLLCIHHGIRTFY